MQPKHRLRTALLLVLTVIAPKASAEAGWTDEGTVQSLNPTGKGRFIVEIQLKDNPSGCRNPATFYRDYGRPGTTYMFDVMKEALIHKKRVKVYVTGRCDLHKYSEIDSVILLR